MNVKTLALSFFAVVTTGSVVTIASVSNSNSILALAQECDHVGNHYLTLQPTETESGTAEYWVCCKCHEHFLSHPEPKDSYTWNEAGIASQVDEMDDRYIPAYSDADFADYLTNLGFGSVQQKEDGTYVVGKFSDNTVKNVVIPEGVSELKISTFRNRASVEYVVIPTTLTSIYSNAFSGCSVDLYFVGDTTRTVESLNGVKHLYKIQGTGWDYVDGVPTAL